MGESGSCSGGWSRAQFSSVHVQLFATPWTEARQASLSITNSCSPPKLMSIESVMPSNNLILCHPLLLLPSVFPSIRVFSIESVVHIRWPKYWSFSLSINPSNEYSGLISFGMDWLDLLAVQGTLKSLLQHQSSKASILRHSAFFIVQLLHPYMTTGKAIALTRWTFVGKVESLLFNMLSRTMLSKSLSRFSVDVWGCVPVLFFGLRQPLSKGLMPGLGFFKYLFDKIKINQPQGASLAVQWLRCCIPQTGDVGFIPGWRTKIPHAK